MRSHIIAIVSAVVAGIVFSQAQAQTQMSSTEVVNVGQPVSDVGTAPVVKAVETQETQANERPLMIVRFNARYVHYQNSLVLAVTKAKAANPHVKFRVVSYSPAKVIRGQVERNSEIEKNNLSTLLQQIRDLGIEPSHITYATQIDDSILAQEIHIFVE